MFPEPKMNGKRKLQILAICLCHWILSFRLPPCPVLRYTAYYGLHMQKAIINEDTAEQKQGSRVVLMMVFYCQIQCNPKGAMEIWNHQHGQGPFIFKTPYAMFLLLTKSPNILVIVLLDFSLVCKQPMFLKYTVFPGLCIDKSQYHAFQLGLYTGGVSCCLIRLKSKLDLQTSKKSKNKIMGYSKIKPKVDYLRT